MRLLREAEKKGRNFKICSIRSLSAPVRDVLRCADLSFARGSVSAAQLGSFAIRLVTLIVLLAAGLILRGFAIRLAIFGRCARYQLLKLHSCGAVLFGGMKSPRISPPPLYFPIDAARVAREAAVRAYDAVAGDDDRDFVVPYGAAHGLR